MPAVKLLSTRAFYLQPRLCVASRLATCSVQRRAVSYLSDPANTGKRARGVNFDTVGSWNNRIELAINVEESIRRGRLIPMISLVDVGEASLDGRRQVNEDRTIAMELAPNLLMFGIFDGHGGPEAVNYVVEHLPLHVKHLLDDDSDLTTVLRQAYLHVNDGFTKDINNMKCKQYQETDKPVMGKTSSTCGRPPLSQSSGSTATVCVIRNSAELAVAHVGDSRALLGRKASGLLLTEDHEPESTKERERIEQCKGRIIWSSVGRPRVNGVLEMTRSIGDVELKKSGVTAEPDVRSLQIHHGSDAFLALTTDGVHGVLNNDEIVQIVSSCVDANEAAHLLTDQALLYGSTDNCTTLIVPFGAWGKFDSASTKPLIFSRGHYSFSNR